MRRDTDDAAGDQAGVTLIELIVGILVSTIVLIGVGTILVNAWLTQNDVLSTSEATNRGQLLSSAVEKAMRNGLYFDVSAEGRFSWCRRRSRAHSRVRPSASTTTSQR